MGEKEISSGGASFSGYIYQTLYAILLCMEDEKWDRIKIEPVSSKEQIDILLMGSNSLSGEEKYYKKIQVKKRKNSVSEEQIRKWINKLKNDDDAENYELCLFGYVTANKECFFIKRLEKEQAFVLFGKLAKMRKLPVNKCICVRRSGFGAVDAGVFSIQLIDHRQISTKQKA